MMSKYKAGDKVVLTVSDVNEKVYYPHYEFNNNFNLWEQSIDELVEPLSTYTEPLEDTIQKYTVKIARLVMEKERLKDENERLKAENEKMSIKIDAYELCSDQREEEYNQAFNKGAEAAWELAKKFVLYGKGCYSDEEVKKIFGFACGPTVLRNYTYKHATAKVAEWEKAKEEIKVGDVCMSNTGNCFAIRTIDHEKGNVEILWKDLSSGIVTLDFIKSHCTNTDRRIDIDSISQQIGGKEK